MKALGRQLKKVLEMVTENKEEQKKILASMLVYLNDVKEIDVSYVNPDFDEIAELALTLDFIVFLKAWTFGISCYKYSLAAQKMKKEKLDYIR